MLQEFAQQVKQTAKSVVSDIHTALPGKIVSFDPEKGVAVVQPKGKFVTGDGFVLEYPQLTDVPVAFPYCQAANVGMVFPIKPEDNCLIIISEVELDEWRSGAESEASLRFDLTSAMAIPDLMLGGSAVMQQAVAQNAIVLVSDNVQVTVGQGTVAIQGNLTVSGNMAVGGTGTIGGIVMNTHTHTGVHGETSGPH